MKHAGKRDRARRLLKRIFVSEERTYEYHMPASDPMGRNITVGDSIADSAGRFIRHVKRNSDFFRQASVAYAISILAGLFAGIFLGHYEEMLLALPGLIVLVPAAIGMRGNIFSSLGSRLGSALHLGTVKTFSKDNHIIRSNIYSSIILSVIFSVLLAFIARIVLLAFGIKSITLLSLVVISFVGGIISGIILLATTFVIAFASFRRGWNPDNISSPIITALGDMFTIPSLLLAAFFTLSYQELVLPAAVIILAVFAACVFRMARAGKEYFADIVRQSSPVLFGGMLLDAFAGMILQSNMGSLSMLPVVLLLIPGFLEQGGNIGNILASRLSTKLHLGAMEPKFSVEGARDEIINTYILSAVLFPAIGLLTFAAGYAIGIGGAGLDVVMKAVIISGILLATAVMAIAFFISIASFRFNLDPDNTTLPLIASSADIIGIVSLMAVFHVLGVF
ncbi:MAG: magnesium transporter [Candidatus Aenigmarchaeota archaeon]|nr:magnesium transporter [Candidatus Aenigmarchaeota archaeon]